MIEISENKYIEILEFLARELPEEKYWEFVKIINPDSNPSK